MSLTFVHNHLYYFLFFNDGHLSVMYLVVSSHCFFIFFFLALVLNVFLFCLLAKHALHDVTLQVMQPKSHLTDCGPFLLNTGRCMVQRHPPERRVTVLINLCELNAL